MRRFGAAVILAGLMWAQYPQYQQQQSPVYITPQYDSHGGIDTYKVSPYPDDSGDQIRNYLNRQNGEREREQFEQQQNWQREYDGRDD